MIETNIAKTPVLMIDDDELIAQALTEYLDKFNYEVDTCLHPEQGMKALEKGEHRLLLLDVMLPGMNGLDVCKLIRQSSDIPIIMLTARGDVKDKVMGFEYGADDYLAKPFEPRELIARMNRLLERYEQKANAAVEQEPQRFEIDKEKRKVVIDGQIIELTSIEFDILYLLSCKPGKVYDRNTILRYVKGLNENVQLQTRAIDNSVSRLRRKLSTDSNDHEFIRTVWGQGYSFVGIS